VYRENLIRAAALIAALGTWCVTLAACSGTSVGTSKRDYIGRAGAICRDASDAVRNVKPDSSSADSVATSIRKVVAIERAAARQLRALKPPTGDAHALGQWLSLVDDSLAQLDVARHAAAEGDAHGAAAANARSAVRQQQADAVALRYGVTACAAPP
jgi:hypothetical protein